MLKRFRHYKLLRKILLDPTFVPTGSHVVGNLLHPTKFPATIDIPLILAQPWDIGHGAFRVLERILDACRIGSASPPAFNKPLRVHGVVEVAREVVPVRPVVASQADLRHDVAVENVAMADEVMTLGG